MAVYGRGSEWRRWDLHIHAPGTALNDDFGDWDEFVDAVEQADAAIAVVGVTDYASINTYKVFKKHHDAGRMKNILLAIPNIEFRISPETKAGKGINLHLLISPEDPEHVERIEEALGRLMIHRDDQDIPCSRVGLMRLGKLTDKNLSNAPDAAYREGVNQFKVDMDVFRKWFADEKWLSKNAIVAVAAGSNDGVSGLKDGGYQSTSTTLLDPQVEIPEFDHGLQVVRMRREEVRGEYFGDDRAGDRQTGQACAGTAAFVL